MLGDIIGILVIAAVVVGLGALVGFQSKGYSGQRETGFGAFVAFAMLLFLGGLPALITTLGSTSDVVHMVAFYNDTKEAYEVVAERAEEIVIQVPGARLTDLAQQHQATAAIDRLKELREQILWYNKTLQGGRVYNSWPIIGFFVYDVPDYLRPLTVEEE